MQRIYLVRSGCTVWHEQECFRGSLPDIGLSECGEEQIERLGRWLVGRRTARIIASPQQRAVETASILGRHQSLKVLCDHRLRARSMESWQGMTRHAMQCRYPAQYHGWSQDPTGAMDDGGENLEQVGDRCSSCIQEQLRQNPDQHIIVVSHGDPLRAAAAVFLDVPLSNIRSFSLDCGSVTILQYAGSEFFLELLNFIPWGEAR